MPLPCFIQSSRYLTTKVFINVKISIVYYTYDFFYTNEDIHVIEMSIDLITTVKISENLMLVEYCPLL